MSDDTDKPLWKSNPKAYRRKYYADHRDEAIAKTAKWRAENRERHIAYSTQWNKAHPEKRDQTIRRYTMKKFGITQSDYDAMLRRQHGLCSICGRPPSTTKRVRRLVVDHDHASGVIRGLLCQGCNFRLGWYEKNATSIAWYLKGSRQQ